MIAELCVNRPPSRTSGCVRGSGKASWKSGGKQSGWKAAGGDEPEHEAQGLRESSPWSSGRGASYPVTDFNPAKGAGFYLEDNERPVRNLHQEYGESGLGALEK